MSVIGKCPDCGWPIYDGHVSHRCYSPLGLLDDGEDVGEGKGIMISLTFISDVIMIPRAQLEADMTGVNGGGV